MGIVIGRRSSLINYNSRVGTGGLYQPRSGLPKRRVTDVMEWTAPAPASRAHRSYAAFRRRSPSDGIAERIIGASAPMPSNAPLLDKIAACQVNALPVDISDQRCADFPLGEQGAASDDRLNFVTQIHVHV